MEEHLTPPADAPGRSPIWKLAAYFAGLVVFGQIARIAFERIQGAEALRGFAKANQVISQSLDVTHDIDSVIVTVWSLLLTFVLVLPLGWVYMHTKAKEGYDRTLVQTLIIMGMVVCGFMMLIQDQFSRALALVGVVSAIRFRTNLRDPKDAVYMLISIGIGMGAGLQVYRVAGWLTTVMCVVLLVISKAKLGEQPAEVAEPEKGKKKDKKEKDKKDKKKQKDGATADVPSGLPVLDRLERIAASLEDVGRGVKRPNTAILLEAMDAEAAMGYVAAALARYKAPWHLVTFAPAEGTTRLEYMVRLDGDGDTLGAVVRDIEGSCGTTVRTVEVRFVPRGDRERAQDAA